MPIKLVNAVLVVSSGSKRRVHLALICARCASFAIVKPSWRWNMKLEDPGGRQEFAESLWLWPMMGTGDITNLVLSEARLLWLLHLSQRPGVNRANGASEKDVNPLLSSLPPFMKFASFASCRWGKNEWTIGLCFQQTRKIITCSVHQCTMFRVWPFQRRIYLFYSSFISFPCVWDTAREGPQERCILIALWRGLLNRIILNLLYIFIYIYIVPIICARFADDVWLMTSLFPWCL